jgi:hypothetical protein
MPRVLSGTGISAGVTVCEPMGNPAHRRLQNSSTCEPPRRERLTPDPGSRNLAFTGCSMLWVPEVALVVRRLIASMVLVACLLGIVQPALAYTNCASRPDCCPAGCAEQLCLASPCVQAGSCCALRAASTPSVSAVRPRTAQGHASGVSPAIALPAVAPIGQHPPELRTRPTQIPAHANQSLTYLRTARLRL